MPKDYPSEYSYILGGPFFRQYVVSLAYTTGNITIYYSDGDYSPITPVDYPDMNKTNAIDIKLNAAQNGTYTATMYAGNPGQLNKTTEAAISLLSHYSMVPSDSCTDGTTTWFTDAACTACQTPGSPTSMSYGNWSGDLEEFIMA